MRQRGGAVDEWLEPLVFNFSMPLGVQDLGQQANFSFEVLWLSYQHVLFLSRASVEATCMPWQGAQATRLHLAACGLIIPRAMNARLQWSIICMILVATVLQFDLAAGGLIIPRAMNAMLQWSIICTTASVPSI
jgi:hypothetical protein